MRELSPQDRETVLSIIADTLGKPAELLVAHASLVDDLGAESIDILDLAFRLEAAFDLTIDEGEIWAAAEGLGPASSPEEIAAGIERMKARVPGFDWERFPKDPKKADLARLVTVQSIVDTVARLLPEARTSPS